MAETPAKKKRILRKTETVRERSVKPIKEVKPRRIKSAGKNLRRPFAAAAKIGKKEYYLPLPKNKVGNFLNKKRSLIPSYFKASYSEIKLVSWPNAKTTVNLSIAVFLFAFFFGLVVALADYGLDKLFKQLIIKQEITEL